MHLVDDEYRVATNLWQHSHLLDKVADILYGVVRCGIELVDIERAVLVERATRIALITRLVTFWFEAVYCLCEDAGAGGLSDTSRSAEEVGVSQLTTLDGIFERRCNMRLSHDTCECCGTIFTRRYNKFLHSCRKVNKLCTKVAIFRSKCRLLVTIFAIYDTHNAKIAPQKGVAGDLSKGGVSSE